MPPKSKKHADPVAEDASASASATPAAATSSFSRRGGGGSVTASLNANLIRDPEVADLVKTEQKARQGLNDLLKEMRELQKEKDTLLRTKIDPARDKLNDRVDGEFTALQKKKNDLHGSMDSLRLDRSRIEESRDRLKLIDFEFPPLVREINTINSDLEYKTQREKEITARREALLQKTGGKTVSDAEADLLKVEAKITQATKKGESSNLSSLAKEKAAMEKLKKDIMTSYNLDEELIAHNDAIKKLTSRKAEAEKKKDGYESERKTLRERLTTSKSIGEKMDAVRKELDDVKKALDAASAKRKNTKIPGNEELTALNEKLSALRTQRDATSKELDTVAAKIPVVRFDYDPTLRGDVVGPRGANLNALQNDFGIAIEVDREKDGEALLFGGKDDCEQALEAMKAMLVDIVNSRKKIFMKVEPSKCGSIIGSRGSNISRIQEVSGAKVDIDSKKGDITLTGTQEAIDAAKALIDEQLFNSAEDSMKFERDLRDLVYGKGGATIRQVESDSGCKKIRVDRDTNVIHFFGPQDAVAKAKSTYSKLLSEMAQVFTMRVDDRMIRLIIGKGGSTISEIQAKSNAIITIRDDTHSVHVRGSKEAVETARAMIEDLTRREEIKIPFEACLYGFLTTRDEATATAAQDDNNDNANATPRSELDKIRIETGCDQVSAIHSEMKIVVRGKKENVTAARLAVQTLLMVPDLVKINYPEVLGAYLLRRNKDNNETSVIDTFRAKMTKGVIAVDADRKLNFISVTGTDKEAVRALGAEIKEVITALAATVKRKPLKDWQIGTVIGPQGRTISDLSKKHKVEINVDRGLNSELSIFPPIGSSDEGVVAAFEEIEKLLAAEK